jgi:adenylate kinase family enzyme
MELQTIVFFGKSGAGKGTQSEQMINFLRKHDPNRSTFYVETGNLLRQFVSRKELYAARLVEDVLSAGGLLPEFIPVWAWSSSLIENAKEDEHLIFDGVSRRESEAPILADAIKFFKRKNPKIVLINVSDNWARQRLLERGRYDDTPDKIAERHKWFKNNVEPAINFFRNNPDFVFIEVNGEQEIQKVHDDIIKAILSVN